MFRLIKIAFNATLLVLAIIGFNAIGGQKYVEIAKTHITNFIQERAEENAKKLLILLKNINNILLIKI